MFLKNKNTDPIGQAVSDYFNTKKNKRITVLSNIAEKDFINSAYLFRSHNEMPDVEKAALEICSGKILDIGAAAGCHSIHLQNEGFDVTALEKSPLCCEVMKLRGISNVVRQDIWDFVDQKFDTIILLMNGIGIAGDTQQLPVFLRKLKSLLNDGGSILTDSVDIEYLFELDDGSKLINLNQHYHGEIMYTMKYKKHKTGPFPWLFIDEDLLIKAAKNEALEAEVVYRNNQVKNYLVKIK